MGLSFLQEIQESFTAATEADDPHGRANVKRLKAGMEWFVKVWADEDRAWTPALATQWGNALATWLELEEITRRLYGWQGCPMGGATPADRSSVRPVPTGPRRRLASPHQVAVKAASPRRLSFGCLGDITGRHGSHPWDRSRHLGRSDGKLACAHAWPDGLLPQDGDEAQAGCRRPQGPGHEAGRFAEPHTITLSVAPNTGAERCPAKSSRR